MPATYTVKQVADLLGYSTNSIYTFLKEKRIRSVRVGKGRFRIPQTELNRLLMFSGKAAPVLTAAPVGTSKPTPETAAYVDVTVPSAHNAGSIRPSMLVPSLFDWFAGISSIILGFSMFLFSHHLDEFAMVGFSMWVTPIRIAFITAGLGLIYSDMRGKATSWWRRIFLGFLSVGYAALATVLWLAGDLVGVLLFGSLTVVLLVTILSRMSGTASFSFYIACMTLTIPVVFQEIARLNPTQIWWATAEITPSYGIMLWVILGTFANGMLFWSYRRAMKLFWTLMAVLCGMLIGLSIWYTGQMYWGRALFLLVTAMVGLFLPSWHALSFEHKSDRKLVFLSFGTVLTLFLLAIGVIRLLQTAMLQFASVQLVNKVSYGRLVVESTLASVEQTLAGVAQDTTLVSAIAENDTALITTLNRGIFEANRRFRYLATFDATGSAISVFPFDADVMGKNFSDVSYIKKAMETKSRVVTNIFQGTGNGITPLVAVVVPVLDQAGERVIGILFGAMDLAALGDKLQGIATPELGEEFILIDANGKRLMHSQTNLLNSAVEAESPLRLGLEGKNGIADVYNSTNERILLAYDGLPQQKWAIGIQAPMTKILAMTRVGMVAITSLIALTMTFLGVLWSLRRTYKHTHEDSRGSP